MSDPEYGLVLRFKVTLDDHTELGAWTKCEGLSVEYDVQEIKEGGQNDYIHRLAGRAKYQNIKLTRPIDKDTGKVAAWLASVAGALGGCCGTNPQFIAALRRRLAES